MLRHLMFAVLAAAIGGNASAQSAQSFVAKGATGTFTVDYLFESAGKSGDRNDTREWKIRRSVTVVAELVAQPPQAMGVLLTPDGLRAQQNALAERNTRAAGAGAQMAREMQPNMERVQQIVAKCGDDEKCIERETMKFGFSGDVARPSDASSRALDAAARPQAVRFQQWQTRSQRSRYTASEELKLLIADPLCTLGTSRRCFRNEQRSGSGEIAEPKNVPGTGLVETDAVDNTIRLRVPLPMGALAVDQVISTDHPEQKGENGKRRVEISPGFTVHKPLAEPIVGARSGERKLRVTDADGFDGMLTVKWSFVAR